MVVNYLNFVFLIKVKAKSKYRISEFRFSIYEKHEMALWAHGFICVHIFNKNICCSIAQLCCLSCNIGFPNTINGLVFLRLSGAFAYRSSWEFAFLIFSKIPQQNTRAGAFLISVTGLQVCNFIKKTPLQVFLCETSQIFSNIFLTEHLQWLLLGTDINGNKNLLERSAVLRGGSHPTWRDLVS